MLNERQKQFVREYIIDFNATQAAIRAGYSPNGAAVHAHRMLRDPNISKALKKEMDARSRRTEITADRVIEELAKIGFSNIEDYMEKSANGLMYCNFTKMKREQAAAISEMTIDEIERGGDGEEPSVTRVKLKLHDKRSALVDLGRHLGLFVNRVSHEGADGGPVQHEHRITEDRFRSMSDDDLDEIIAERVGG